jgi:predicted dehydrogenase
MHAGPTYAFLKAGVHVICDKPLTVSLAEAKKMQAAVDKSDRIFALTHNYTAYPLVRRMREMAQGGELGEIRLVQVEYPQDWLTGPSETTGNKQAEWRVDPKRSGAGGALGDIGTHAFNLADYVTGLKLAELAADLTSFGVGRELDDNVQIMLRYANGARGALWASQIAPGNENGLRLRVYGTKDGAHWVQANPNECCGRRSRSRRASSPAAGRIRAMRRRGLCACRRVIRKAISKALPTSIRRSRLRSKRRARGRSRRRASTSRPSKTASKASLSSRPQ